MGRRLVLLLVGSVVASGCLGSAPVKTDAVDELDRALGTIQLAGIAYQAGQPADWPGRTLTSVVARNEACLPDNCERVPFQVERPSDAGPSVLQVALGWSSEGNTGDTDPAFPNFDLRILTAAGQEVARSSAYKWSAHVILADLPSGDYVAQVRVRNLNPADYVSWVAGGLPAIEPPIEYPNPVPARGSYWGSLLLTAPAATMPEGNLLPDLVVHTMRDLRLSYAPVGQGHAGPPAVVTVEMPTAPGCTDDEYLDGARRCLRFTVGLGNAGKGPLELGYAQGATSALTEETVPARQCITNSDGTGTVRPAGNGSFHRLHGHDHQRDILAYDLYAYEAATRERGEALRQGEKFGYGFYRQGLVDEGHTLAWPADVPSVCGDAEFPYWLHPGWYDIYMYWRTGQFIDISGVPDGTYLLAATVNPAGDILESDATNNEAWVAFELVGNQVTVLEPWQPKT